MDLHSITQVVLNILNKCVSKLALVCQIHCLYLTCTSLKIPVSYKCCRIQIKRHTGKFQTTYSLPSLLKPQVSFAVCQPKLLTYWRLTMFKMIAAATILKLSDIHAVDSIVLPLGAILVYIFVIKHPICSLVP